MAVPNTNTFTQQDVKAELDYLQINGLVEFFSIAEDSKFDPNYVGSKNSLLNFRNYGATITLTPISLRWGTTSLDACSAFPSTYYINGPNLGAANKIYSDSLGTTLAPTGYYSDGTGYWRQWNSTTQMFTSSGGCI